MVLCTPAIRASFFRELDCPAECRKFGSSTNGYCNDGYAPEKEHRSINWTPKLHLKSRDLRTTCSQLRPKLLPVRRSSTCLVSCWEQKTSELTGDIFLGGNLEPFLKWRPNSLDVKIQTYHADVLLPSSRLLPTRKEKGAFMTTKGWDAYMPFWSPLFLFLRVNWPCSFSIHRFVSKVAQQFGSRFQGYSYCCHFEKILDREPRISSQLFNHQQLICLDVMIIVLEVPI